MRKKEKELCSGSDELQCFLIGAYNDDKEFRFDKEESSVECMQALSGGMGYICLKYYWK